MVKIEEKIKFRLYQGGVDNPLRGCKADPGKVTGFPNDGANTEIWPWTQLALLAFKWR